MRFARAVKKLLLSSISIRLLSVAFGFVSSVLVNRALGLELRGSYTTIYTYAMLLQTALNMGIAFAYVPMKERIGFEDARECVVSLIWLQFGVCVAGSAVFLAVSFSAENAAICVLMCATILNGQIVFVALIDDIRARNLVLLASAFLYMAANAVVLVWFPGQLYLVIGLLALKYCAETLLCGGLFGLFSFRPALLTLSNIRLVLSFGLSTAVIAMLITLNYNVDVVVLNALGADESQVGIFGVAYTLSNMLWFIPDAFKEYVYHKSAHGAPPAMTVVLVAANMGICILICVAFFFAGRPFLGVLYGAEFEAAFEATMIVFVGIIPMVAFKLVHPHYVNDGRSLSVAVLLCVSIAVNVLVASALVPGYGAVGAAIATVVAYSFCGALFMLKFVFDYGISAEDVRNAYRAAVQMLR